MASFVPPYPSGLPVGPGWIDCTAHSSVSFPFDGSVVAEAPVGSPELALQAVEVATAVKPAAAGLSAGLRRELLLRVHRAIQDSAEELERLLVLETGKPLVDCRTEVARTLVTWAVSADEVSKIHGETVPLDLQPAGEGMFGFWTRRPIGTVIGISGFNYPLLLATHKIAPAIAAGCPIICKPAPATPLSTLWLVHLVREAAREVTAPPELVQAVTGDAVLGRALVTDPRAAVVSFTGSAASGHRIARETAPRKALLELGSNAALIVAEDAQLDRAVDAVIRGGYYASGQACISVQRVLLVESVAAEFERRLLTRIGEVTVGDPRDSGTRVAPLIDEGATERVLDWIEKAVGAGARCLAGGVRAGRSIEPTVLADVPDGADAWDEEIFGPVVCLRTVPNVDRAIDAVNASHYGLHASVFTDSLSSAFAAIESLDVGGVVVNEVPGFRSDIQPYGGVKDSGNGREGPRFAIEEFTVTRMATIRTG